MPTPPRIEKKKGGGLELLLSPPRIEKKKERRFGAIAFPSSYCREIDRSRAIITMLKGHKVFALQICNIVTFSRREATPQKRSLFYFTGIVWLGKLGGDN